MNRAVFSDCAQHRQSLGLVSVYMSVESDKKVLDWFKVMSFIIRRTSDLKKNISRRKVGVASHSNFKMSWLCGVITSRTNTQI